VTRLPIKSDDELDDSTRRLFQNLTRSGAKVPDLYRALANAPDLLPAWTDLAWPLRGAGYSSRGLRELLIMRTAQLTAAQYEWKHHWGLAIAAGISEQQLLELGRWARSDRFSEPERAALAFADELITTGAVADEMFARLSREFGTEGVIHLSLTISFYVCVAMFTSAMRLSVEDGYEHVPPLDERAAARGGTL
jgi:alkylhydroperoxidase family enzyme